MNPIAPPGVGSDADPLIRPHWMPELMKKTLLFLALSCVSVAASATESNGIGYSHVELEYLDSNPRPAEYRGPGINGSLELGNGFFATGSYRHQRGDDFLGRTHVSSWTLGGGYAAALGNNLDWVSQAAYVNSDAKATLGITATGTHVRVNDDVNGFRVSSGVRGRLTPNLLGHAYLGYQDLGNLKKQLGSFNLDGNVFADLGLEYHFSDSWAATTRVDIANGFTEYAAGVRLSF